MWHGPSPHPCIRCPPSRFKAVARGWRNWDYSFSCFDRKELKKVICAWVQDLCVLNRYDSFTTLLFFWRFQRPPCCFLQMPLTNVHSYPKTESHTRVYIAFHAWPRTPPRSTSTARTTARSTPAFSFNHEVPCTNHVLGRVQQGRTIAPWRIAN